MSSCERRTMSLTRFLNAVRSFLHMTAASMLAGDSSLGSESMDMTDTMIASTPKIGLQRSIADSCGLCTSSPGGCKIEMHTLPSSCTVELRVSGEGRDGMRNNSAQQSLKKTGLTIGVPDCRLELHFRGAVWEVGRKV